MSEQLVLVTSRGLVQVACLAWFVYDYFLSLELEVEHLWGKKLNVPTLLYISTRALSFVMLIIGAVEATRTYALSEDQCHIFHWVEGVGSVLVFINTQLVLQYRLWAIYDRSTRILVVNGVLFLIEAVGATVLLALYYASQKTVDFAMLPDVGGETCITVPQRQMALVFLTVFLYEMWLVALALFRTVQVRRLVLVSGHRSLTEVVAYDSLTFFVLIAASMLVVIILWIYAPVFPGNASIAFTRAAGGVGAARLILHIKAEAQARTEHTYDTPSGVGVSLDLDAAGCSEPRFVRGRNATML